MGLEDDESGAADDIRESEERGVVGVALRGAADGVGAAAGRTAEEDAAEIIGNAPWDTDRCGAD